MRRHQVPVVSLIVCRLRFLLVPSVRAKLHVRAASPGTFSPLAEILEVLAPRRRILTGPMFGWKHSQLMWKRDGATGGNCAGKALGQLDKGLNMVICLFDFYGVEW